MTIAVPAKKNWGNRVLLKFCDFGPNLNFLVLYEYEKKFCPTLG